MANLLKLGIAASSTLGNPPTGDYYEYYDRDTIDALGNPSLTTRDSLGVDSNYTTGIIPTPFFYGSTKSQDFSRASQTTEGLVNDQGNIFETYLSHSITPTTSGKYILSLSFVWSHNINNDNFDAELVSSGGAIGETFRFLSTEPKEIAGTGVVLDTIFGGVIGATTDTGTDIRVSTSYQAEFDLVSGTAYNFDLNWTGETANDKAAIYRGIIIVEQKTII